MTDYWLLWMSNGNNEWEVIVEGDLKKSCMKQGILRGAVDDEA